MDDCAVVVSTIVGDAVTLEPPVLGRQRVSELRKGVAAAWGVSPAWVQLLYGSSELRDDVQLLSAVLDGSKSINVTAVLTPVCDISQLEVSAESADLVNEWEPLEEFPPPRDICINMMPFIMGDKASVPEECHPYWHIIAKCGPPDTPFHRPNDLEGTVAYLTIDERLVRKGETHRSAGIHCESPGCARAVGGGELVRWGMCRSGRTCKRTGGIFMCSNVPDSCKIWQGRIKEPGTAIGPLGSLEHFREALSGVYSFSPEAGVIAWVTDTTPHESIPMQADTYRQYVRVVVGHVSVWYARHSTPNPLGIKPDAETRIVDSDKFVDAKLRGWDVAKPKANICDSALTAEVVAKDCASPESK